MFKDDPPRYTTDLNLIYNLALHRLRFYLQPPRDCVRPSYQLLCPRILFWQVSIYPFRTLTTGSLYVHTSIKYYHSQHCLLLPLPIILFNYFTMCLSGWFTSSTTYTYSFCVPLNEYFPKQFYLWIQKQPLFRRHSTPIRITFYKNAIYRNFIKLHSASTW